MIGSPIVIDRTRPAIAADPIEWPQTFAEHRALNLRGFIAPPFLSTLQAICARADFQLDPVRDSPHRTREAPDIAGRAITVLISSDEVRAWLENVSMRGPLRHVYGRVLRIPADNLSYLDWHDDLGTDPNRCLGITIDLNFTDYEGGLFEMREKSGQVRVRHRHQVPGAALIFDTSPDLEHRLAPVTAGGPRQVFTGWFTSKPKA